MKIIPSFLLSVTLLTAISLRAQSHLDYSYTLDALSYSIPGYESEELYFKAHLYPVFHAHSNDSLLDYLNGLFAEELVMPKSAQLKERLVAVKIDNLMSDKQVLDMLKARIGMLNEDAKHFNYQLDVRTDRIDFPDNRETVFNYRFKRETSEHPDLTIEQNHYQVLDWATGKQLTLGTLGGKNLIKCIENASKTLDFKADDCEGETSLNEWKKNLGCETPLGKLSEKEVVFYLYDSGKACEKTNEFPIEIDVQKECFENDKPCN